MKLLLNNTTRARADFQFVVGAVVSVAVLIAFVICLHAF
jgi:hypothetical protein